MARDCSHNRWTRRSTFIAMVISLMAALALVLPAVHWLGPDVHRWMMLRDLTADDMARRERALNFVVRRAADDERVRQGAVRALEQVEADDDFQQIMRALDLAGVWRRPTVSEGPWLRWLTMIAALPEPAARLRAAQRLAALGDLVEDDRVPALLTTLLHDDDATVRYNALAAAAELAGATATHDARLPYEALIAGRTADEASVIAREAWLLVGLLDPMFGHSANWREAEPAVAEAMLWASVQTNPDRPIAAAEAMNDAEVPARVRQAAAYALASAHPAEAEAALLPVIEAALAGEDLDRIVLWRAVRGVPLTQRSRSALRRLTEQLHKADEMARIELAARHRLGLLSRSREQGGEADVLRELAAREHHWLAGTAAPRIADAPPAGDMVRLVRVATDVEPDIAELRPLLRHAEMRLRDLACMVAAERLERDVLEVEIGELLADYHDGAKMSGALLAGMTGLQLDLLRERAGRQSNWAVGQMMRLGLWMQGQAPALDGRASRLLARPELPRTSVLLALLHREPTAAWDDLLAPQGEPTMDLVELFDHYRWWAIARQHLPASAPPFWWWADQGVQRLQVDVLRSWYLLNRWDLRGAPRRAGVGF